jgi:hypothetical protein
VIGERNDLEVQFDISEVVMRLLNRHPDETDADEPGVEDPVIAERRGQRPAQETGASETADRAGIAGAGEP